jgi:diguanylate cyclase (GGDEF)-like protein
MFLKRVVGASSPVFRSAGGYWLIALVVVVFGFAGILARTLVHSRDIDWQRAAQAAQSLTKALESEILNAVQSVDFSLQGISEKLQRPDVIRAEPALRQLILFDWAVPTKSVNSILVLNEKGVVTYNSRGEKAATAIHADRDYFQHHAKDPSPALYIGRPIVGRSTGTEVVTLSRRLSNPDGSFAGVVVASLRLDYLKQLFKATTLGEDGSITLSKADGTVLMRWPFDMSMIGRDTSRAELFRHLADAKSGVFESATVIDGVHRLVAYRQVGELPLVIGVGQSTEAIFGQWMQDAAIVAVAIAGFGVLAVLLIALLYRELRRRIEAEHRAARRALTDALTGLHNRRSLDRTAELKWRDALRDRTELALAMVDVDNFKSINDQLGHRHGDMALRCVARAIRQTLRRGHDIGARYGGDEFAILLPATAGESALVLLDELRDALARVALERAIATPTLSIGVASMIPTPDDSLDELFRVADAALYEAKERGRDRTVMAAAQGEERARATARAVRQAA